MKQAIEKLFTGIEGLPADFVEKAMTVFEAAVLEAVGVQVSEATTGISAQADEKLAEAITEQNEKIASTLDVYLSEAVVEWAAENAVVIDSKLKTEIAESFVTGLKSLFEANNVVIGEATEASTAIIEAELTTTKAALAEATTKLTAISEESDKAARTLVLSTLLEGVADTQAARVKTVLESMTFADAEDFKKKAGYVVEGMTGKKVAVEAGAADMGAKDDKGGKPEDKDDKGGKPEDKDDKDDKGAKPKPDGIPVEESHTPDPHMASILAVMGPKRKA